MKSAGGSYAPLSTEESEKGGNISVGIVRNPSRRKLGLVAFTALIVGIGLGIAIPLLTRPATAVPQPSDKLPSELFWSSELAQIKARWTRFNGSQYGANQYRGPPSEQLDNAWNRFTDNEWMPGTATVLGVSLDDVQQSNNTFSTDTLVELDEENGGGYMAGLELFHQLHCLNMLRKWTYIDHYQKIDHFWAESNRYHLREHTDHCIDILRQFIMCHSDTGLVMFHWVKKTGTPTPDFSTVHRCKDPEQVLDWAQQNAAPITHHIWKKGDEVELEDFP